MTYKPMLLFEEGEQGTPVKSRTVPKTSLEAYGSVKEMKEAHYLKIINALQLIRVGGTYEELSSICRLDKAQVNRRLSEMVEAGIIYNVGTTRPTMSGRKAMIRQLVCLK